MFAFQPFFLARIMQFLVSTPICQNPPRSTLYQRGGMRCVNLTIAWRFLAVDARKSTAQSAISGTVEMGRLELPSSVVWLFLCAFIACHFWPTESNAFHPRLPSWRFAVEGICHGHNNDKD